MGRRGRREKEDVGLAREEAARLTALGWDRRRIAVHLAKMRYTATEVAGVLGVHRRTARDWIRESGEVPTNLEMTDKLYGEGFGSDHIAKALRITRRAAQDHLVKIRGNVRQSRSVRQNVTRFYEDPEAHLDARFTRSDAFGRALLAHCHGKSENPKAGLSDIRNGVRLFGHLVKTRRAENGFDTQCRHLQCRGLNAHVLMRKNERSLAIDILETNLRKAAGHGQCCEADASRRLALGYGQVKHWKKGLDLVERAIDLYQNMACGEHDLLGHGLAYSLQTRSYLRFYTDDHHAAIADVEAGVALLVPERHTKLYGAMIQTLAGYLAVSGIGAERSRSFLADNCHLFDDQEASEPRMRLHHLLGMLAKAKGNKKEAAREFKLALDDAEEIGAEYDAVAILADRGELTRDPRRLLAGICLLCVGEAKNLRLASWIADASLRDAIQEAYLAAREALRSSRKLVDVRVFEELRAAAGASALAKVA